MKLPQLSLRDLFWLVLVAACLCGWWLHHKSFQELQRQHDEAIAAEERAVKEAALSVKRALAAENNLRRSGRRLSEWEKALKAKEEEYEVYRKAYFYYREQLPVAPDDEI